MIYSAMRDEFLKIAEDKKEKRPPHPGVTALKHVAAYGAGTGAGYLGLHAANALHKARTGRPLVTSHFASHAIPAVLGLGSLAFQHAHDVTLDKMQEDSARRRKLDRKKS